MTDSKIVPPIFVFEGEVDLLIFDSPESLLGYIEAPEVDAGVFEAFDRWGRSLTLSTVKVGWWQRDVKISFDGSGAERVAETRARELMDKQIEYLGLQDQAPSEISWDGLIIAVMTKLGFT